MLIVLPCIPEVSYFVALFLIKEYKLLLMCKDDLNDIYQMFLKENIAKKYLEN